MGDHLPEVTSKCKLCLQFRPKRFSESARDQRAALYVVITLVSLWLRFMAAIDCSTRINARRRR
jgi:hypothetical protein